MTAIGIDFGTCNSCVGVFQQGKVEIIANDQGKKTIPSYVAFTDTECLVGEAAKNQVEKNPENTIYDIKRLLGRKFDDPHVQKDMKHWPFKVINDNGKPKVEVHFKGETKSFYPEEIAAIILRKMKETAEAYLGKTVTDAVISVPGYSNNAQREATRDAAAIAGLNTLVLINEPTAAAVAYKLQQNGGGQKPVLIFAVGGGFSDVSVMSVFDDIYQVKLTAGDAHLGGEDFDNQMVNHFLEEFLKEHKKDPSEDKHAMQRLRIACEEAKKTLSSNDEASIELDSFFEGINFHTNITRATFEELNLENFSRLFYQIEEILSVSIIGSQIENVVLVGGSTRIPKLQIVVQDYFQAREINKSLNPDEAVAYGAAIKAATLSDVDGVPCVFNADVVPISIGLEITDETIIKKNTPFPATSTTVFSTQSENQACLPVKVFEGKHDTPKGVNTLGTYKLSEIPPAPQGVPVLEVTFEVDESGILNVFAEDQSGGKTKELTVTKDEAFSKEEIEKMAKEVEALFKEHKKQ